MRVRGRVRGAHLGRGCLGRHDGDVAAVARKALQNVLLDAEVVSHHLCESGSSGAYNVASGTISVETSIQPDAQHGRPSHGGSCDPTDTVSDSCESRRRRRRPLLRALKGPPATGFANSHSSSVGVLRKKRTQRPEQRVRNTQDTGCGSKLKRPEPTAGRAQHRCRSPGGSSKPRRSCTQRCTPSHTDPV